MTKWEIILGVVFGLLVNEVTDISPWVAKKVVKWAACRWTADPEIAAGYAEEWAAVIEERPGKLYKLLTALTFAGGAFARAVQRRVKKFQPRLRDREVRLVSGELELVGKLPAHWVVLSHFHSFFLERAINRHMKKWEIQDPRFAAVGKIRIAGCRYVYAMPERRPDGAKPG